MWGLFGTDDRLGMLPSATLPVTLASGKEPSLQGAPSPSTVEIYSLRGHRTGAQQTKGMEAEGKGTQPRTGTGGMRQGGGLGKG